MRLIEILIVIFILLLVVGALINWQADIIHQNLFLQSSMSDETNIRISFRDLINGLRSARTAATGAYALANTTSSTLTFYTDLNQDGEVERYRYFLEEDSLKKGYLEPSGNPLDYNESNESVTNVVSGLSNYASSTLPVFSYYGNDGSLLALPVTSSLVRLIKITFVINGRQFESQVTVRSLRDNP